MTNEPKYNFYGENISTPLSDEFDNWETSRAKKIHDDTKSYVDELDEWAVRRANYVWKVVDARLSEEDGVMSYFKAYGVNGDFLPQATFGVHFGSLEGNISTSGFKYRPKHGGKYYVPYSGFPTMQEGGYTVQVLDKNYPSEGFCFGLQKFGKQHQAWLVSFRLFKVE